MIILFDLKLNFALNDKAASCSLILLTYIYIHTIFYVQTCSFQYLRRTVDVQYFKSQQEQQ